MILMFLGSWRNTVIVSLSIPLSIAAGVAGLFLTGQTINLMTLGGLALAIGMLVDNATVTIENIHRNQALGKPLTVAILDGSDEVIQPLTVATLAICIVFFPVVLLTGPARFLFIPLAITVVLAMLASYVLSFTVVPALARYLLKDHDDHDAEESSAGRMSACVRSRLRARPQRLRRRAGAGAAAARSSCSAALRCPDRGDRRARAGRRHRLLPDLRRRHPQAARPRAARHAARGNREDRGRRSRTASARSSRPKELRTINRTIGLPFSLNLAFVPSDNISGMDARDADLAQPGHKPTVQYQRLIRDKLERRIPRHAVLFPDRRHREPGAQFRPGGADRHPDPGSELPALLRRRRRRILQMIQKHPGRGRSAHRPGAGLPDAPDRRRSPARRAAGHRAARRRQQHADVACGQRAGRPDLLSSIRRTA